VRFIDHDQRTRITRLIRAEHLGCLSCGSKTLVCGDVVRKALGGYNVDVFCDDFAHPEEAPRKQPSFSFPLDDGPRVRLR